MADQSIDHNFQVGHNALERNPNPPSRCDQCRVGSRQQPRSSPAQDSTALTIRWLGQSILPDEDWADLVFLPQPGKAAKSSFQWQVFQRKET